MFDRSLHEPAVNHLFFRKALLHVHKIIRSRAIVLNVLFLVALLPGYAATPAGERLQDSRQNWFHEARFGLFIHWGIYSVPAGEWEGHKNYAEWIQLQTKMPASDYEKYAAQFNPVRFDAREWVRVATNAGMKYIVITAKHHDGFCMWDTAFTDYNVVTVARGVRGDLIITTPVVK